MFGFLKRKRHGVRKIKCVTRANSDNIIEAIQKHINKCKDLNSDDPTGLEIYIKSHIQAGLEKLAEQNPNLVFCSTSYYSGLLVINKSVLLAKTSVSEDYRVEDSVYYDLIFQWESGKVCLLNIGYRHMYSKGDWHSKAVVSKINKQLKDSRQYVVNYDPNDLRLFTIGDLTNSMEKMQDL